MSGYSLAWAKRQVVGNPSAKAVLKVYADWASEDFSTWVSNDELIADTELDIKTIRKARALLVEQGYLTETAARRGDTRSIVVYQMLAPEGSSVVQVVDRRTQQPISLSPPTREEYEGRQKRTPSKNGGVKGVQKRSPSKNGSPSEGSPSTFGSKPLHFYLQGVPNVEGNKADVNGVSSSNAREPCPVDNSEAAAAAAFSKNDNPSPERELTDQLVALEAARGKRCAVDRGRDRTHVLAWVGRGVKAEQLREAHRRAVAARERDADSRAVNVGFLSRFVDELLSEAPGAPMQAHCCKWWLGGEAAVCDEGARLGVRPKRVDESLPEYRVLVAKAAGKGPWIDHVLKDAQRSGSERFYRSVIDTLGDALLPTDFYA